MPIAPRKALLLWLATIVPLMSIAMPRPAAAFQTGQSPDFTTCSIWFNDEGQPLRSKAGREIGSEVPCPGQTVRRDTYSVVAGAAKNTLVIRDRTHRVECTLVLAPGSKTVVVPTVCKRLGN